MSRLGDARRLLREAKSCDKVNAVFLDSVRRVKNLMAEIEQICVQDGLARQPAKSPY